jgi:hypothetical protein
MTAAPQLTSTDVAAKMLAESAASVAADVPALPQSWA